jgi:hypothetical protein
MNKNYVALCAVTLIVAALTAYSKSSGLGFSVVVLALTLYDMYPRD